MIVYNVTYSVDKEIAEDWITWMKDVHLPMLLKDGVFENCKMLKVLSHDDEKTFSYAVQHYSRSLQTIERYFYNEDIQKRYGERVLSYPTLLEEV